MIARFVNKTIDKVGARAYGISMTDTLLIDEIDLAPRRSPRTRRAELESLVRRQLELLGEDPDREGLRNTPARVAKALPWLTRGYDMDVHDAVGDALFEEKHANMVMVRDIEMYSLCEHHMLPFF